MNYVQIPLKSHDMIPKIWQYGPITNYTKCFELIIVLHLIPLTLNEIINLKIFFHAVTCLIGYMFDRLHV